MKCTEILLKLVEDLRWPVTTAIVACYLGGPIVKGLEWWIRERMHLLNTVREETTITKTTATAVAKQTEAP